MMSIPNDFVPDDDESSLCWSITSPASVAHADTDELLSVPVADRRGPRFKDQVLTEPLALDEEEEQEEEQQQPRQQQQEDEAAFPLASARIVTDSLIHVEQRLQLDLERQYLEQQRQQLKRQQKNMELDSQRLEFERQQQALANQLQLLEQQQKQQNEQLQLELERQQLKQLQKNLELDRQRLELELQQQALVIQMQQLQQQEPPQQDQLQLEQQALVNKTDHQQQQQQQEQYQELDEQQQHHPEIANSRSYLPKKRWIKGIVVVVAAFVVLVAAAGGAVVVTGVCWSKRSCHTARRAKSIRSYINSITLSGQTLRYHSNPLTAEERALQWLIDDDLATSDSDMVALRQRYALGTLYFQTTTGFVRANWATDIAVCDWEDVGCEDDMDRYVITRLDLSDGDIRGRIPADLGLLTELTILSLRNNALTGPIPSSLGQLTALNYLYLDNNALTGTIPSSFGKLTVLTVLRLDNNLLTGTIPLCSSGLSFLHMVADCDEVICPCCSHCCPTS